MESTRDLGRVELWQESLERSLARRGKLARASIELNRLRPERDFGDTEFVHESAMYWNLRRRAAAKRSMTPVMGAGGLSALALLAAALPTFFGDSGVSGRMERIAMGVGARSRSLPAVPSASNGTSVTSVPAPATDVAARSVAAPAPAVSRPSTYSPTPTGHPRVATTPPHLTTTPPHLTTTPLHLTTARVHVTESVVHATGAPVGVRHLLAADDATVASDSVHGRNRTSHPTKASVRPHASGGAAVHVAGPVRAPSHGSATHHATGPANGSASNHAAGRTPARSRYAATGSGGTGLGIRPTRPKNLAPTRQKTTPPARQKTTAPPAIGCIMGVSTSTNPWLSKYRRSDCTSLLRFKKTSRTSGFMTRST